MISELRELAERLTEIADDVEIEMYARDIESGAGYWTIQAIVRLRLAANWAKWAAAPYALEEAALAPLTMQDTELLLRWLAPDDRYRLDERIDRLLHEDKAALAGERLLEEILGEEGHHEL